MQTVPLQKDLDGSLTGTAGAVVTKRGVYFADTDANCSDKSGWNMQVCGGRYVKVSTLETAYKVQVLSE